MATNETPAPQLEHEPPSLPNSPLPKRTKVLPQNLASILNEHEATPTPEQLPVTAVSTEMSSSIPSAATAPVLPPMPAIPSMSFEPPPPALQIKLLSSAAKAPTRGSQHAAGYDLYASKEATVPARGKVLVDLDISIAVPAGSYGRIAPRSGLASKHGIDTGAGVIDADYRGPVKVLLFNFTDNDFAVAVGERVAQLIVERIYTPDIVVVEELDETVRGAGGFGSTGGFGGNLPSLPSLPPTV